METSTNLDEARRSALDLVDKSHRQWRRAIRIFAAVEGFGWLGYIILAWMGFSLPVLLAVAVLILYTMSFTWAMAMRDHMDTCTQRILKAIEATSSSGPTEMDRVR